MPTRNSGRICAALAIVSGLSLAAPASAGPTLVVDLSSGQILHEEQAARPWYPASLTKLMTVYVALEAVRQGRLTLRTPMRVTHRAYRTPPSKMAFKPGLEVTLESALKIIMVKSANDVAITIAEGVSGSVEAFAAEMNAIARRLGMSESHFVNPNGLHHPSHISSARDMAVLARALYLHFPKQSGLYGIGAIRVGRRRLRTHNGLIGRYPGANGMKTGFVCASGFNVVASATRYGRTLIAVILGSPSPRVRTFHAMALLDKGFGGSSYGRGQVQHMPRSAYRSPPNMRSEICNRSRRRVLIQQFMMANAPAGAGAPPQFPDNDNSAASFFAADRGGRFQQSGDVALGRLKLPPRAPLATIHVYVGRAPGWTGNAVGPADPDQIKETTEPKVADKAQSKDKDQDNKVAAVAPIKAGEPISLRGSKAQKKSKKRGAKGRVASRSHRLVKRKARRGRHKSRSRRAIRARSASRRKVRARSRLRRSRRRQ